MENGKRPGGTALVEKDAEEVRLDSLPPVEPPVESEPELRPEQSTEYRINRIVLHATLGKWRGRRVVLEAQTNPQEPLCLFAKDDDEPLPWGRALEELLAELLAKAEAAAEGG